MVYCAHNLNLPHRDESFADGCRAGPVPEGPLNRTPRPGSPAEEAFLAIGSGAGLWLTEAGAAGVCRPRPKMADAVALAALHGTATVDWALGHAAVMGRFGDGDLASIIAHQAAAKRNGRRFGTVLCPQLIQAADHVIANRLIADEEQVPDLTIGKSSRHVQKHLLFACAELYASQAIG